MENRTIYDELDSFLKDEESSFLKDELKGIDDQIRHFGYGGSLEGITELWELRKNIVNGISKEMYKEESSFLKDELKGIDDQIKACKYGDSKGTLNKGILDEVIELFKLRKIIVGEIKKIIEGRPPEIRTIGGVDNEENED